MSVVALPIRSGSCSWTVTNAQGALKVEFRDNLDESLHHG